MIIEFDFGMVDGLEDGEGVEGIGFGINCGSDLIIESVEAARAGEVLKGMVRSFELTKLVKFGIWKSVCSLQFALFCFYQSFSCSILLVPAIVALPSLPSRLYRRQLFSSWLSFCSLSELSFSPTR